MIGRKGYVYILINVTSTVLYIGVTSNLVRRIYEHKSKLIDGFSKRYNTTILIYYEEYDDIGQAIYREKCLKKWKREWKDRLIDELNPSREDLSLRLEV